jgi:tetratricopeptide (TPR) repeat protein
MRIIKLSLFVFILSLSQLFAQSIENNNASKIFQIDQYIIANQFDKAIPTIDSLIHLFPEHIGLKERLGFCYFKQGEYLMSEKTFNEILQLDSMNVQALNQLAQISMKQGNLDLTEQYYDRLLRIDSTNSYYYKQSGIIKTRNGNLLDAPLMFYKALERNQKDIEIYVYLTEGLLQLEMYETADSVINLGLQIDSVNYNLRMFQAKSFLDQKKYSETIKVVNKILQKRDTLPSHANLLGTSYFSRKDYSNVIPCMQFLINKSTPQDWMYYYLGVALRETGEKESALKNLKLAIQKAISPGIASYYTQLAVTYEQMSDFKNAIWAYEKSTEYKKSKNILFRLAQTYDRQNLSEDKALKYYKAYISSGDTNTFLLDVSKKRISELQTKNDTVNDDVIIPDSLLLEAE